jgi:hypothetical protein
MSGSTWRSRSQPTPSPDSRPQGGLGRASCAAPACSRNRPEVFCQECRRRRLKSSGRRCPTQHAVVCQKSDRDDAPASSARTLSRVSAFRGPHMDERPRPVISYEEERRCSSFCNRRDVWTRRVAVHRHNSRRFDGPERRPSPVKSVSQSLPVSFVSPIRSTTKQDACLLASSPVSTRGLGPATQKYSPFKAVTSGLQHSRNNRWRRAVRSR